MQAPKEIEDTLITLGFDPSEIYDESVRWQLSYPDTDLDSFGSGTRSPWHFTHRAMTSTTTTRSSRAR